MACVSIPTGVELGAGLGQRHCLDHLTSRRLSLAGGEEFHTDPANLSFALEENMLLALENNES